MHVDLERMCEFALKLCGCSHNRWSEEGNQKWGTAHSEAQHTYGYAVQAQ